jgi:acetyltransferase-like isoleucine patch superfamily enzyme
MNFKNKIRNLQAFFIKKAGDKQKTWYLRRLGVKVGENCHINTMAFSTEPYLVEIGNHVAIAAGTEFITHDGAIWCFREEIKNGDIFGKIKIGNNVFIGNNCTILPNTQIGDNSIIGAGSVVRGIFPENSVIIGNPAKVIMKMSMQKLLYLQNKGLMRTSNLSEAAKDKLVKEQFGIG